MGWSAKQYTVFENERTRPVIDLLNAVRTNPVNRAIDIGCGPGNSTEILSDKFPAADISAFDPSENMIAAARERLPQVNFSIGDVNTWSDTEPFDVILSNAVFQWVTDHDKLFPKLINQLSRGGSLAVQMPDNFDSPAHVAMRETAQLPQWADKLKGVKRIARESAEFYYELLKPLCARLDIWETIYRHHMPQGAAAIVEFFKGSSLRPFLAELNESEQAEFLEIFLARIAQAYPALKDGTVLLPFPRLFIVAVK